MSLLRRALGLLDYQFNEISGELNISGRGTKIERDKVNSAINRVSWDVPSNKLKTVNFVNVSDITEIENHAFYYQESLNLTFSLPDSITKIGNGAFGNCKNLYGSLKLPYNLELIGSWAFRDCIHLSGQLNLPNSLLYLKEHAFTNCTGFTGTLVIPPKVGIIYDGAFSGCTGIKKLFLPEGLHAIFDFAFMNCSCLEEIKCHSKKPPILHRDVFYKVNKDLCKLIIPKGESVLNEYKSIPQWKDFSSIVQQ